jgi:branched-subunit amino acid transport protein AzlD
VCGGRLYGEVSEKMDRTAYVKILGGVLAFMVGNLLAMRFEAPLVTTFLSGWGIGLLLALSWVFAVDRWKKRQKK